MCLIRLRSKKKKMLKKSSYESNKKQTICLRDSNCFNRRKKKID